MANIKLHEQSATIPPGTSLELFQTFCQLACEDQRGVLWWIGDLAIALERQRKPHEQIQAWPEWVSPGLIARCKSVAEAYRPEDRNINASWTTHMNMAKRADRVAAVQATVEAGHNSDEARKNPPPQSTDESEASESTPPQPAATPEPVQVASGWLLAIDLNYYLHRVYSSGADQEAGTIFVRSVCKMLVRLAETKGLTDAVFCIDSPTNHRRILTENLGWEKPYKDRTRKDDELVRQIELTKKLLSQRNLMVVSVDDMEADDVMASYAKQFPGKVTLMTVDKDLRQCLGPRCNILKEVEWVEDPDTNKQVPKYEWVTAKSHVEDGLPYSGYHVVGITPEQWPHFQALAGDSTDDITGCKGIGSKFASNLIKAHGSVQGVIAACRDKTADLSEKLILSVIAFEEVAEAMLKLTTMRTDLNVPMATRFNVKDLQ